MSRFIPCGSDLTDTSLWMWGCSLCQSTRGHWLQGLCRSHLLRTVLQDSCGFSHCLYLLSFLWNPSFTCTNAGPPGWVQVSATRMLWAVETGGSAPLGTCLPASSFLRWRQSCQEQGDKIPQPHSLLSTCMSPLQEDSSRPAAHPSFSRKLFLSSGDRLFLWSLGTCWGPSIDPRPT